MMSEGKSHQTFKKRTAGSPQACVYWQHRFADQSTQAIHHMPQGIRHETTVGEHRPHNEAKCHVIIPDGSNNDKIKSEVW